MCKVNRANYISVLIITYITNLTKIIYRNSIQLFIIVHQTALLTLFTLLYQAIFI